MRKNSNGYVLNFLYELKHLRSLTYSQEFHKTRTALDYSQPFILKGHHS